MTRRKDPVTPEVRTAVLERDLRTCVATLLDPEHVCRDRWEQPGTWAASHDLTLDHVQDGYGRMGKRAPSDAAHLVTLCWGAHLGGWGTAHRPELRAYLMGRRVPDD